MLCALAFLAAVVQPVISAPQLLIPAAGSTPGANGTFFHSDIGIANLADHDQLVKLQWLPEGASSTFGKTITIPSGTAVRSNDFVAEILGQSGLGAILVSGVTSNGDLDSSAALYVQSRIWTPQPGNVVGTTSQSLPALPTSIINTQKAGLFFAGVLGSNKYRTNVGIVNLDPNNAQTINITIAFGALGNFTINVIVPPMGMQQVGIGSVSSFPELPISNITPAATRSSSWVAYVSTVDNVTGDAWSELALANSPDLNFPILIGKE